MHLNIVISESDTTTSNSLDKIINIYGTLPIFKEDCKEIIIYDEAEIVKMYENIIDNINEEIIMGKNNINDSKIINFIMLAFSKPKILKTKF